MGFAHAGRAQEQEGANGAVGIFDIGPAAANGSANSAERFILANDFRAKHLFHLENFLRFSFGESRHGNAGLLGDDIRDVFFIDDGLIFFFMIFPVRALALQIFPQIFFRVAQFRRFFIFLPADRFFFGDAGLFDLSFQLRELRRLMHHGDARFGSRFIDQIDGFVRQKPAGNVAFGKITAARTAMSVYLQR